MYVYIYIYIRTCIPNSALARGLVQRIALDAVAWHLHVEACEGCILRRFRRDSAGCRRAFGLNHGMPVTPQYCSPGQPRSPTLLYSVGIQAQRRTKQARNVSNNFAAHRPARAESSLFSDFPSPQARRQLCVDRPFEASHPENPCQARALGSSTLTPVHTVDAINPALPLRTLNYGELWYINSLLWVMQDLYHQPNHTANLVLDAQSLQRDLNMDGFA